MCFTALLQYSYLTKFLSLFLSLESGRKQKTPKKFTGEQPSISGTFGLKGNSGTSPVSQLLRTRVCTIRSFPGGCQSPERHFYELISQ